MAATDAIPVPRKNIAFRFYFAIRKPSDSTLITTWTGQDSEVSLDGAAFADCTNEATEIGTSGVGYIDLTAAEMNADSVVLKITVTNTGAVPLVFTFCPESAGDYRVADTQKVDVETIKTQALTVAAGITFGVYVGGTAAAAIASTALSTSQWTSALATDLQTTNTTVATNLNATVSSRLASASYTAPPSAATISTQVAADLLAAHGTGSWTTATGFSTPTNVTDAQTAILAKLPAALEGGRIAAVLDSATALQIDKIEAATSGTVTGAGTSTEVFVGTNVTLTITVDASGNRSAVEVS